MGNTQVVLLNICQSHGRQSATGRYDVLVSGLMAYGSYFKVYCIAASSSEQTQVEW